MDAEELEKSRDYKVYLLFLGLAPIAIQNLSLSSIAKIYAVLGSLFMPFLALTLLYLNGRCLEQDTELRNPWWVNLGLLATLLFFVYQGVRPAIS